MNRKSYAALFCALAALAPCRAALADEAAGASAVELEIGVKADFISNRSGGIKTGTGFMNHWDVKLAVDADKAFGWQDTKALLHVINDHGGRVNATHVGSFMGVDNIEVGAPTTKVFQAWLERGLLDGDFALLAGLYPIDQEFYVTDATAIFLHPTGGMAAEVAQTGRSGPSIFPTSAFGIRAKWRPTPRVIAMAALLDGVPGDPNNPRGTHVRFNRGDGAMAIAELSYNTAPPHAADDAPAGKPAAATPVGFGSQFEGAGKYAVGFWRYTPRFDDRSDTDTAGSPLRRVNRGWYVFAEETVYREAGDPQQGLALYLRHGTASADINTVDRTTSFGLRYKGLLPGRDEDEFAIGQTRAHAAAKFVLASATPLDSAETALEIAYRAQVLPWLAIQPSLQRIRYPNFDPAPGTARVLGVRFDLSF